jgi:predicted methyltransferase
MVLTFRNVHDWLPRGHTQDYFKAFYRALKPGGILGITDHRADPSQPQDPNAKNGYARQDYMIRLAEQAGFKLLGSSEINANPRTRGISPYGICRRPCARGKRIAPII